MCSSDLNPGTLSYASTGLGGPQTLVMELFKSQTGVQIIQVPYKGAPQAISDVIGGRVHIFFDNMAGILPQVRSGKLRALAVATAKRSAALPDLPTLAEAGIPGYEASFTGGYAVPAKVPREIVMRLNGEINKAFQTPVVADTFLANGISIVGGTPEQYAEHIRVETEKWSRIIRGAGIKPE